MILFMNYPRRLRRVIAARPYFLRVVCEHFHVPDTEAEGEAEADTLAGKARGGNKCYFFRDEGFKASSSRHQYAAISFKNHQTSLKYIFGLDDAFADFVDLGAPVSLLAQFREQVPNKTRKRDFSPTCFERHFRQCRLPTRIVSVFWCIFPTLQGGVV